MTEGDVYFVCEFRDDEAAMVAPQYLDEFGAVPELWIDKIFYVDLARLASDGVFVRESNMNGEIYYVQCTEEETAAIFDDSHHL